MLWVIVMPLAGWCVMDDDDTTNSLTWLRSVGVGQWPQVNQNQWRYYIMYISSALVNRYLSLIIYLLPDFLVICEAVVDEEQL